MPASKKKKKNATAGGVSSIGAATAADAQAAQQALENYNQGGLWQGGPFR